MNRMSEEEVLVNIQDINLLAGVDEAGAGNLAGNLIVAAVILDPDNPISGITDSKVLSEKKRLALFPEIIAKVRDYCIVEISPKEIDNSNILAMRKEGMRRAVEGLKSVEGAVFDGNFVPEGLEIPSYCLIKGDMKVAAISAASILAKATVDMQMRKHHENFPQYGFNKHKGYGTKMHIEALEKYGACEIHRFSYKPVKKYINNMNL